MVISIKIYQCHTYSCEVNYVDWVPPPAAQSDTFPFFNESKNCKNHIKKQKFNKIVDVFVILKKHIYSFWWNSCVVNYTDCWLNASNRSIGHFLRWKWILYKILFAIKRKYFQQSQRIVLAFWRNKSPPDEIAM